MNYPALTENAETVLAHRYYRPGESSWEDVVDRVVNALANDELDHDSFKDLMMNLKFLPNSPCLFNAGTEGGTLSACFVIPIEDSMESIMKAAHTMAMVQKYGGGTGFPLTNIRPKGAPIQTTHGRACGPIAVLKVLSSIGTMITQGGKRDSANMAVMRVDHPDIEEFIECKQKEGEIHNFNISVGITDEFMQAVANGWGWQLKFDGEVYKKVDARDLFMKICKGAWRNGEPGAIFLDEANRDNPIAHLGEIQATNPCVTSDTWVMTSDGPKQVVDLIEQQFEAVVNGVNYSSSERGFFSSGIKDTYTLSTVEGFSLDLTADHRLEKVLNRNRYTENTEWVKVSDLNKHDVIKLNNHRSFKSWDGSYSEDEGYLAGYLIGDGTFDDKGKPIFTVWSRDGSIGSNAVKEEIERIAFTFPHRSDFKGWQSVGRNGESRLALASIRDFIAKLGIKPREKSITPEIEKASSRFYKGFLRGFFDADGSVQFSREKNSRSIRLSQSDIIRLEAVQRMLLRLGINSTIYKNRRKAGKRPMPDGKGGMKLYPHKAQHELVVSKDNIERYAAVIGFIDADKQRELENSISSRNKRSDKENFTATVSDIKKVGKSEVFDVQIYNINAYDSNGLVSHNCGEIPMQANDSCNLGSIDVGKYVNALWSGEEDWTDYDDPLTLMNINELEKDVMTSVRFLDRVIDENHYAVPEIKEMNQASRRIGLGVMGWADLLVRLGIPYDSVQAVELGTVLMKIIQTAANYESLTLANMHGQYPAYKEGIKRRHSYLTTVAPTGTISMIAGCSSGIEPLFGLVFKKQNILEGESLFYVNDDLKRVLENLELDVDAEIDYIYKNQRMSDNVPQHVKDVFRTSSEIHHSAHVDMQAAFQQNVDNAISKTINMAHDVTVEDVWETYVQAWRTNCKGITVYRDGSREKEVLTKNVEDAAESEVVGSEVVDFSEVPYRNRSTILAGETHRVRTSRGTLYVTVNKGENDVPFEVFITVGKSGSYENASAEALGRLCSLALRRGVHPDELSRQLVGIVDEPTWSEGDKIESVPDAVGKVLKNYAYAPASDAEKQVSSYGDAIGIATDAGKGKRCYECGYDTVYMLEGCEKCISCGWSKC